MKGTLLTAASIVAVTFVVAAPAYAEEGPTRAEYVSQVEPICEANTTANKRILKNVRPKVRNGKLQAAGGQFIRASEAFGATIREIAAVPRPPADDARLVKWFGSLKVIKTDLREVGKALKEEKRIKATHETIRLEHSANAANNVSFVFGFRYCRITPSRFT